MPEQLTKEQLTQKKADSKQREVVKGIGNRLLSQYSFQNIKTWNDIYKFTGFSDDYVRATFKPEDVIKPVSLQDVKNWIKKLTDDVENKIREKYENIQTKKENSDIQSKEVNGSISITDNKSTVGVADSSKIKEDVVKDESGYSNDNNYGLVESPKERAFLYYFQKKAAAEVLQKVIKEKKEGILVLASTGTGKTFIKGAIERRLADINFLEDTTWGHIKCINVTRATVVEQDKRVFKNFFGIDPVIESEVINIEQRRSRAGQIWIKSWTAIENGEEVEKYEWKPMIHPARFHLDECQAVKNEDSIQHKICIQYSAIKIPVIQIYYSATPFTRVSEAKAFAIATKKDISHITGIPGTRLSLATWPTYAAAIAAPSPPDEYNEAAVERLMKDLDDYVVRVKGVRWQFNAVNKVEIIDFDSDESRQEYDNAWQKYLARKAKLEESVIDNPRFQALVELGIFLAAAEYCKRYILAKRMYEDVKAGNAAVAAVKFKKTIIAIVKILTEEYGVSRDSISLVWGGGQTQLTAKQKLKAKVLENQALFEAQGISMEDMMLEDVEERILEDLPEHLRLGGQSKEQRQKEIDRFQSGKSLYCIHTFKSGGVGLSLHHSDERVAQKVRHQKNGYAIVEDIPKVPVRPRKATISPTWSPIEMVQGEGRCPRVTSLSDTEQTLLFYRGTVEEQQAFVVTHRLKCLSKVVRQHESWQDLITNHVKAKELARKIVEEMPTEDSKDGEQPNLVESEDNE